jgi:hypothetical protein
MMAAGLLAALLAGAPADRVVRDDAGLRGALQGLRAGDTVLIEPGTYRGGHTLVGLEGLPGRPIVIRAADPARPPVIRGSSFAFQLSRAAHVELRDLVMEGAEGNGLNIDDGGTPATPSHDVLLSGLVVRDSGGEGNLDGIKLSGLDDFRVERCRVERWGDGGSGIDMVGCHRGEIVETLVRHREGAGGASGIQAKGGTSGVRIRRCRFEHAGQRAVNLGGSTGLAFFRPAPEGFEARDLTVEDCVFVGSMSPVAFVGVDGATVRHNTFYRPGKWVLRILQENREPGFVPCRNGVFADNVIAFESGVLVHPVNVGDATDPGSFTVARNVWWCLDDPRKSRVGLPAPLAEADARPGIEPGFRDAASGDLHLGTRSRARPAGPREMLDPSAPAG